MREANELTVDDMNRIRVHSDALLDERDAPDKEKELSLEYLKEQQSADINFDRRLIRLQEYVEGRAFKAANVAQVVEVVGDESDDDEMPGLCILDESWKFRLVPRQNAAFPC